MRKANEGVYEHKTKKKKIEESLDEGFSDLVTSEFSGGVPPYLGVIGFTLLFAPAHVLRLNAESP